MTQEDKELLLKDLSARLPYDCKVVIAEGGISGLQWDNVTLNSYLLYQIEEEESWECIKPYLRPMSSMTEEEEEEFENLLEGIVDGIERWDKPDMCEEYDWLNSHHFDYRGLIEKGLAIEAPKEMYEN